MAARKVVAGVRIVLNRGQYDVEVYRGGNWLYDSGYGGANGLRWAKRRVGELARLSEGHSAVWASRTRRR